MKDMILEKEKEKERQSKQEAAAEETSFDVQLDLIQRDKIPERDISQRKKEEARFSKAVVAESNLDQLHHLDKLDDT